MMSTLSIAQYFPFDRVKVVSQSVHADAGGVLIGLQPDLRYRPLCHACGGRASTVHSQGHRRIIRDLSLAGSRVQLLAEYRKVWCGDCGCAKVERLSFCDTSRRVTHRLARYVHELCRLLPVTQVARHLALNPKTVKAIDLKFLEDEFGGTDYRDLRFLAIDEIAVRKGQVYMTVVLDYLSGRVVWMGEGRNKATVDAFFDGMPESQKALIEAVAMDMWHPYINRVSHHCPQAKIVFDFFHVVQAFGLVIDEVRRREYRQARQEDKNVIRGSRFLLLKNAENLSSRQEIRLDDLLRLNKTLNAVYILKDQLKELYRYGDRRRAEHVLDAWCKMAIRIDHPAMHAFIRRLRRHADGILNHCEYPIGTSGLEGTNNKIKVLKRQAYGYHDSRYFSLKVKQAFQGKTTTHFLG